ncbi:hypothetical protein ACTFIV_002784 [Dictyostelium citrinum]
MWKREREREREEEEEEEEEEEDQPLQVREYDHNNTENSIFSVTRLKNKTTMVMYLFNLSEEYESFISMKMNQMIPFIFSNNNRLEITTTPVKEIIRRQPPTQTWVLHRLSINDNNKTLAEDVMEI